MLRLCAPTGLLIPSAWCSPSTMQSDVSARDASGLRCCMRKSEGLCFWRLSALRDGLRWSFKPSGCRSIPVKDGWNDRVR